MKKKILIIIFSVAIATIATNYIVNRHKQQASVSKSIKDTTRTIQLKIDSTDCPDVNHPCKVDTSDILLIKDSLHSNLSQKNAVVLPIILMGKSFVENHDSVAKYSIFNFKLRFNKHLGDSISSEFLLTIKDCYGNMVTIPWILHGECLDGKSTYSYHLKMEYKTNLLKWDYLKGR